MKRLKKNESKSVINRFMIDCGLILMPQMPNEVLNHGRGKHFSGREQKRFLRSSDDSGIAAMMKRGIYIPKNKMFGKSYIKRGEPAGIAPAGMSMKKSM